MHFGNVLANFVESPSTHSVNEAEADVSVCSRKRYASWQMHLLASSVTITPWRPIRRRLS